tara:strand:- start:13881 stop:14183 length:303 start_codon:yes stop_codon:yes gene_type:complete
MNRYKTIDTLPTINGKAYKRNLIFPEIKPQYSDIYIITTAGDRYDTLAYTYYSDSTLWWIIAGVNKSKKDSLVVTPGVQLRIPTDTAEIIEEFETLNESR